MLPAVVAPENELHLQYRCAFEIHSPNRVASFSEAIKAIRFWLTNDVAPEWRVPRERVAGAWFYNGGRWSSTDSDRSAVITVRFEGESAGEVQWAIRYERPESKVYDPQQPGRSYRIWRTDIGLKLPLDGPVRISIQTAYYVQSTYFGPEPAVPEPTSPKVIKNIIRSQAFNCFAGSEPLLTRAVPVSADDVPLLFERIIDPARSCPLIFMSCQYPAGTHLIAPDNVAWGIAGLAAVYAATDSWVDKQTELLLPEGLRCWGGRIRVYMPGAKRDGSDGPRHRYFTAEQIVSWGAQETLRILTRSLGGRRLYGTTGAPQSIEDIRFLIQHQHLQELQRKAEKLRSQADSAISLQEMVDLLTALNNEVEEKNREYAKQLNGLQGRFDDLEMLAQQTEDANHALSYELQESRQSADELRNNLQAANLQLGAFKSLHKLPTSIEGCAEFFLSAFPSRLRMTERGKKSLRDAEFDLNLFWHAMWAMAHDLHSLFFASEERSGDIEEKFRSQTGIELAMTEGKLTKADKKLMQSRKDDFAGRKIDITPHVKLRAGQRFFRIYFAVLPERLLVIGECTAHMDTAGTRRKH